MSDLGLVVHSMEAAQVRSVDGWFSLSDVDRNLWEMHALNRYQGRYDPPPPGWKPKPKYTPVSTGNALAAIQRMREEAADGA